MQNIMKPYRKEATNARIRESSEREFSKADNISLQQAGQKLCKDKVNINKAEREQYKHNASEGKPERELYKHNASEGKPEREKYRHNTGLKQPEQEQYSILSVRSSLSHRQFLTVMIGYMMRKIRQTMPACMHLSAYTMIL